MGLIIENQTVVDQMSSLHRSPPELVKEILLIDDGSDMEHLKAAHIPDFNFFRKSKSPKSLKSTEIPQIYKNFKT